MVTTCLACKTTVENSGGGVFVTVDGNSYECPAGAVVGVDHVTSDGSALVSNGDKLLGETIKALDLQLVDAVLAVASEDGESPTIADAIREARAAVDEHDVAVLTAAGTMTDETRAAWLLVLGASDAAIAEAVQAADPA